MLKKLLAENFLNTDLHLNQFHFRTGVYKTSCTLSELSAFILMQILPDLSDVAVVIFWTKLPL